MSRTGELLLLSAGTSVAFIFFILSIINGSYVACLIIALVIILFCAEMLDMLFNTDVDDK